MVAKKYIYFLNINRHLQQTLLYTKLQAWKTKYILPKKIKTWALQYFCFKPLFNDCIQTVNTGWSDIMSWPSRSSHWKRNIMSLLFVWPAHRVIRYIVNGHHLSIWIAWGIGPARFEIPWRCAQEDPKPPRC